MTPFENRLKVPIRAGEKTFKEARKSRSIPDEVPEAFV
jgi:hypothetical protein